MLEFNFYSGWLDQVGIRLSQLSTKVEVEVEAELGKMSKNVFHHDISLKYFTFVMLIHGLKMY